MKKPLLIALSSLFVVSTAWAAESQVQTFTFTYSEQKTISEVRLNAKHTAQEIQHGVVVDVLLNSTQALTSLPNDPAMQLVMQTEQENSNELAMK